MVGPGFRDPMVTVKKRKTPENNFFCKKILNVKNLFLLVMPKYERKQNFSFLYYPQSGSKAMISRERERKKDISTVCWVVRKAVLDSVFLYIRYGI